MKTHLRLTFTAVAALFAVSCVAATTAHADSRQDNKNLWRNATIASGAVALYGLTHHKDTLTLAGAAGAAYSAQRYEDDRHSQSVEQNGPGGGGGGHYRDYYEHHDRGHHYGWYKHHHEHHHHHDRDGD